MKAAIHQYMIDNALVGETDTLVVGVSGGVDSIVLCHLLRSLGIRFGIAHVNFQLRGEEADKDEAFVAQFANDLGVRFHVNKVDTKAIAAESGRSIQMVARELRYAWFEQLCHDEGYTKIATAHHQNDQAETVLLNLARGSGIAGLRGIRPAHGHLIRPLLDVTKKALIHYAESHTLTWREDQSNADYKYKRNMVRHKVVPLLEGVNPAFVKTVGRSTERLLEEESLIAQHVETMREHYVLKQGADTSIMLGDWVHGRGAVALLYYWIERFGFHYQDAKRIVHAQEGQSGRLFYSATHVLAYDRDQMLISEIQDDVNWELDVSMDEHETQTPLGTLQVREGVSDVQLGASKCVAHIDGETIGRSLILRTWREGDVFQPLGMRGKKKVSDFMIDHKIPVNLKKRIPVLCSDNEIVWLVGYRLDDRFKITSSTQHIIEFEWI